MKDKDTTICLANLYLKTVDNRELKIEKIVCKKLPTQFLYHESSIKNAIKSLSKEQHKLLLKTHNQLQIRVEFLKDLGTAMPRNNEKLIE